jgi:hypothetical protein
MPRHADWMKRWESFRYIVDALRAYIDRKPLRVETEPDWPLVVELASKQLVSPTIGLVLHDPLGGQFGGSGFLAHLHSTRFQGRMIQLAFVIFSHARMDSTAAHRVKKNVRLFTN